MGKEILAEAKALQKKLTEWRRWLHSNAETGFDLLCTKAFVKDKLRELGYAPSDCGKGIVATVGNEKNGKTFLLRADMDALPIEESSGVPFACKTGKMHACGHDMHTAMLLGAAYVLKKYEKDLRGCVKFVFQPAEELLSGAKEMLDAGVLQEPNVDGAMMLHVLTGLSVPAGTVIVSSGGVSAPAADYFTVRVQGRGCHGSTPEQGVNALTVAARITLALEGLTARELGLSQPAVLTVGRLQAGTVANALADRATLEGTLRAYDEKTRAKLKIRISEIASGMGGVFHATAETEFTSGCPCLVNDENLSAEMKKYLSELLNEGTVYASKEFSGGDRRGGGSEDFAYIAQKTPSVMVALAAGEPEKGYGYPLHHPKTKFDESVLHIGAAAYAYGAIRFLG